MCETQQLCTSMNKYVTTIVLTKHLFIRLEKWKKMYTRLGDLVFHILVYLNAHSAIFIYHIKTKSFTNKIMTGSQVQKNRFMYGINMFK